MRVIMMPEFVKCHRGLRAAEVHIRGCEIERQEHFLLQVLTPVNVFFFFLTLTVRAGCAPTMEKHAAEGEKCIMCTSSW